MKVIHLTHTKLSSDFRILNELRSVIGQDSLELYATSSDKDFGLDVPVDYENELKRLSILILPSSRGLGPLFSYLADNVFVFLKLLYLRPQIIHFHDTYFIPSVRLIAICFKDVRLIYDSHELNEMRASRVSWYPIVNFFLERLIWTKLHSVIAVNKGIADYLQLRHGAKNIVEILNVPWDYSNQNPNVVSNMCSSKTINVCFVGYLVEGRDLDWIVEFFVRHKEFNLHLFGSGDLEEYLLGIASSSTNITFHGFISPELISEKLRDMDIGLCLISGKSYSQYLALPNKIFDFLSNGLRVISYPNPEIVRYIRDDNRISYINKKESELLAVLSEPIQQTEFKVRSYPTWAEQGYEIRNLYK